jgi:hypothetical protein
VLFIGRSLSELNSQVPQDHLTESNALVDAHRNRSIEHSRRATQLLWRRFAESQRSDTSDLFAKVMPVYCSDLKGPKAIYKQIDGTFWGAMRRQPWKGSNWQTSRRLAKSTSEAQYW